METIIDHETGEVIETKEQEIEVSQEVKDALRRSREMVVAGPAGIQIENLAQQIDYAKAMMQATVSIPEHLHKNVGDCLAVIDIAMRANLSPYMLAMQTYVEPKSKRLSFMSQAYHALLVPYLKGDLEVTYDGEGEERTCTVSGVLKNDPGKVRTHTSPPLGKVRPAKNSDGVVKGSPLWTKKPDVQLFYDTSRDWTRIYCPRATLGLYTPDELDEYGPEMARDVTPPSPGLAKRLRGGKVDRKEGHADGAARKAVEQAATGGEATPAPAEETEPAASASKPKPARKGKAAKAPTTPKEWDAFARAWIAEYDDAHEIQVRWKGERSLRNSCGVTSEAREPVEKVMNDRIKELM